MKSFPEAIEAVYPRTEVQLCWKARKPVAADLQLIYRAGTVAEAEQHLAQLEGKWKAYPSVSQVWRRNWARITRFSTSTSRPQLSKFSRHLRQGTREILARKPV